MANAQGDRLSPDGGHKTKDHKDITNRFKKIEAIKAGYITQRMDLTPEESQRFWPVYNAYQKEITTVLIKKKQNMQQSNNSPESRLDDDLKFEKELLDIRKLYKDKFLKVLPAEKVTLLTRCEREFKEQLIQQLKYRRAQKENQEK
ncbi:MAG: hypothetical protein ACOH2A_05340 [Sphingobacteriaceae bacterium]